MPHSGVMGQEPLKEREAPVAMPMGIANTTAQSNFVEDNQRATSA